MSLVLDATVAMAWCFVEAATPETDAVLDLVAAGGAVVPDHWPLEVADGFQTAVRRSGLSPIYRDASLTELGLLPIEYDGPAREHAWASTLRLAERFSLTAFAAAYLELALRRALPLASLDPALRAAATQLGIPFPEPLAMLHQTRADTAERMS